MSPDDESALERRVVAAATSALEARNVVTAVDVLVGIGWLAQSRFDDWRRRKLKAPAKATTEGS